jgi:hypothetical protein
MSSSVTRSSTVPTFLVHGLLPWRKTSDCQCGAIIEADMMSRVVVQVYLQECCSTRVASHCRGMFDCQCGMIIESNMMSRSNY